MTRLNKTKTDTAGRNYFLCECECGKQFELRVDHINAKKCKHGKVKARLKKPITPKVSRKIFVKDRSLLNPPVKEMVLIGTEREIENNLKRLKKIYLITN